MHNNPRTRGALDESGFMKETGNVLDGYLEQGRLVLDGLATQREMLKGETRSLFSDLSQHLLTHLLYQERSGNYYQQRTL